MTDSTDGTDGARHRWDLLLVVTNDRYGSEQFGTVRRVIDATLRSGHSIQVWACNIANTLTEREAAPGEPGDDAADCCAPQQPTPCCPSTADLIGDLVSEYPDQFSWVACKSCSDDRGAAGHVPGVLTEVGFANFRDYVDGAAKTVYIGGV